MIKVILFAFLSLTLLIGVLVIYYWRDSYYDPSLMELVGSFIFLPLLLCLLMLSPYFIYKIVQYFWNRKLLQQRNQALSSFQQPKDRAGENQPEKTIEHYTLNILSCAATHCFGENEEILQVMMQFKSPELDPKLNNSFGLPLLSYRIAGLDQQIEQDQSIAEEDQFFSMTCSARERRIQQLIQQQFQQHTDILQAISRQLKHSALFYGSEAAYQYHMHPGWNPENRHEYIAEAEVENSRREIEAVTRLNRLNIHLLLADSLLHNWDDQIQLLQYLEHHYQLLKDHLHIEFHFLTHQTAYPSCIELLQEISQQTEEVSLFILADSEIDQEWLDENLWQNEQYIAAEYAASWCLTAQQAIVEQITVLQVLTISNQIKELKRDLTQQLLNLSAQLETEQAFVLLLDETKKSKTLDQLQHTFNGVGIHPEYFMYIQSFIGNTQCLGHLFGMLLVTQMKDNVITIVYSLKQEHTYIYCANSSLEQLKVISSAA